MYKNKAFPRICAGLMLGAVMAMSVCAQTYPAKPIRLIAPFPPGGPVDLLSRTIAQHFQQRNGQPVVVENRTGGNGIIGIDAVAKAPADGYTWLLVPQGNITINATLLPNAPYRWERDFTPITLVAYATNVIAINPAVPARTTQEFVAYARANPGKLSYGSSGVGSSLHLIGQLINREAGIDILHVPYKGTVPAMQDLMGGQLSMMVGSEPVLVPPSKAGKLRALAVTTAKRSPTAPDIPTLIEGGVNVDVPSWYGVLVPAKVAPEIVAKLYTEIAAIVSLPDVRANLNAQGLQPLANKPEDFAAQIKRETALWAKVIKEAGIKPE
jgi:tripartite-type tricarboxylate transporter receptor subunit TctC